MNFFALKDEKPKEADSILNQDNFYVLIMYRKK